MNKFKIGDKVIVKSTIGSTNEVVEVIGAYITTEAQSGYKYDVYVLSNGYSLAYYLLELWNPKTDLEGGYEIPKNGLVFYDSYAVYHRILECAYFLWLNGSEDTERNWLDAVASITENKC